MRSYLISYLISGAMIASVCGSAYAQKPPSVLVFFEWNEATLTKEAGEAVDVAIERAKTCHAEAIFIDGHDDTSQTAARQLELSVARAQAIRTYLTGKGGIDPKLILRVAGHGASAPMIETGPDKREPLNRRAEITIICS